MTTEQKHTPTPWYVRTNRHAETDGTPWGWVDSSPPGSGQSGISGVNITWKKGEKSEANARRIVACVNACKDIPTDHLENFGLPPFDTLSAKVKELESQLSAYPADWRRDSSLDSWFPYTAEELDRQKVRISKFEAQRDELFSACIRIRDINTADCEKYVRLADSIACEAIAKIEAEKS